MLTDRQKAHVVKMWHEGRTSGDIAAAVGVTRNTVAGILGRMRAAGKIGYRDQKKKKNNPKPVVEVKLIAIVEVVVPPPPPPPPLPQSLNGGKGINLLQLNYRTCRYIIKGQGSVASTFYCGYEVKRGAYCEPHAAMCYNGREKIVKAKTNDFANRSPIAFRYAQR
jgi:hypothetical protein